jgi:hypothetical protein
MSHYAAQEVISLLTVFCQVNERACRSILCSSISISGTQREHNFRKRCLSDTISWRSDCEICRKCRESDKMVNHLFSWIFSSIACTKPSSTTDSLPLCGSLCTFSRPSLKFLTHLLILNHSWHVLHTPHKVDDECQPVSSFLHSRNGLQTVFHMRQASRFSWYCKHTGRCINVVWLSTNCVHAFQKDQ